MNTLNRTQKNAKTLDLFVEALGIKFNGTTYDLTGSDFLPWGSFTRMELADLFWTANGSAELYSHITFLNEQPSGYVKEFYNDLLTDIFEVLQEAWIELDLYKVRKCAQEYFETLREANSY